MKFIRNLRKQDDSLFTFHFSLSHPPKMNNSEITDPEFRKAVEAMDAGDLPAILQLLERNPRLAGQRLDQPTEGYFARPYLLWFVADNPIRYGSRPKNISDITRLIIRFIRDHFPETLQQQIDYALGLVATGSIPRESGVQIELIDLLIDEGAKPGNGHGAIANGNPEAARRLIERGGTMTLTTAIGTESHDDILRLMKSATAVDKKIALTAAAFLGKSEIVRSLIAAGTDVNGFLEKSSGFHSHATALHQAVWSQSLEAVKLLVEAGASLDAKDRIYQGTPLDWANYLKRDEKNELRRKKFEEIEQYLERR